MTADLIKVAKAHCASAIATHGRQDGDLKDVLAAISAARCALDAAAENITRHLKG